MRTRAATLTFELIALFLSAVGAQAQVVTATIPVGSVPNAVAVNPATNKIYVACTSDMIVIDGATNRTTVIPGAGGIAVAVNTVSNRVYVARESSIAVIDGTTNDTTTVALSGASFAVAVNSLTNKVYVANINKKVTVIDGATNATTDIDLPPGFVPRKIAVDPLHNMIWVTRPVLAQSGPNVVRIDGRTNAIDTFTAGDAPVAVAVDPVFDPSSEAYVVNNVSNDVTAVAASRFIGVDPNPLAIGIDPSISQVYLAGSGLSWFQEGILSSGSLPLSGSDARAIAVNPTTSQAYVANFGSNNVTVIGNAPDTLTPGSFLASVLASVPVGRQPQAIAVNPATNKIYVANRGDSTVSVIDGALNIAGTISVGTAPHALAVNPGTDRLYVANRQSNTVTVIDAADGSQIATVNVGTNPVFVAVNPVNNQIYVVNSQSDNVTVIDGATNGALTVPVGRGPLAMAVNPATNKIYVVGIDDVTVLDGFTYVPTHIVVGNGPKAAAVNVATNKIYVANSGSDDVTVIDGVTGRTKTVPVGNGPLALDINPATNRIYVANSLANTVSVIDGATDTNLATIPSVNFPAAVAVNLVTNEIYVANANGPGVSVIDGATNAVVANVPHPPGIANALAVNALSNKVYLPIGFSNSVAVIDGASHTATSITVGRLGPSAIVADPMANRVYIANETDNTVTVIPEQVVLPKAPYRIQTAIVPLPGGQTVERTPQFNFTAQPVGALASTHPRRHVLYQVDGWQGPWLQASGSTDLAGKFTGNGRTPPLSLGTHILYAYGTDGQDATSTGIAQPLIGLISARPFTVMPGDTVTVMAVDLSSLRYGKTILQAVVGAVSPARGTPTGTVAFQEGTTTLGTAIVSSFGIATLPLPNLPAGPHTITAVYGGSADFRGSTSIPFPLEILKADPVITWAPPASIPFGTPLSGAQLNATADFAGSFVYTPPAGTVLDVGLFTLKTDFTPADPQNVNPASATVSLTVNKATPVLSWNTPAAITFGTPLSAAQLNASANVAGAFLYTPPAGTLLNAGNQTLSVNFTPTDGAHYVAATASVNLTVNKAAANVSLLASANPAAPDTPVSFTATVKSSAGTPTGTVAFSDNGNPLASPVSLSGSGVAMLSLTGLAGGTHNIAAVYGGSNNFNSGSATLTEQVPDYSLTATPTAATIRAGETAAFSIAATPLGGFNGQLSFQCSNLPKSATCSFTPSAITLSGGPVSTTLLITTSTTSARALPASNDSTTAGYGSLYFALLGVAGIVLGPPSRRRRRRVIWIFALMIVLALCGCGGHVITNTIANSTAPAPTVATVTVNVQSGQIVHSQNLSLTIN